MNVAEKLTRIAEKIPQVYEAGYTDGKAGGGESVEWSFNWKQFENNTDEMIMPDGEKSVEFTDTGIIGETAYFGKNLVIHCAGETLSFMAGYGSNARLIVNGVEYTNFPCTFDKVYMESDIEISLGDGQLATPDGQIEFGSSNMKRHISKEIDEFWNNYQNNGTRTNYRLAFGGTGWTDDILKPKYDITPSNAYMMFYHNKNISHLPNVNFDFSQCTNFQYTFAQTNIKKIGVVDTRNCSEMYNTFADNPSLIEIEKLILKSSGVAQTFTNIFGNVPSLEKLTIQGVIGQNINFGSCVKLLPNTVYGIINKLNSGTQGKTITFAEEAANNFIEEYSQSEWDLLVSDLYRNWTFAIV